MITVVNKTNKGLYNQLFHDVDSWLRTHNGEGEKIYDDQGNLREDLLDPTPLLEEAQAIDPRTGEPLVDDSGNPVMDEISSLGELFTFMEFITKHAPIYTRLPLDEEPFFIDANKRSITVPKDFASNGVSVQGDEIAEILFFKINRFFDATDLSLCDIYVQWRSSELDEEGKPKEGVSRTWIHDVDSEPGYLIFGWPISSAITKAAGNITFSVRFYRLDDGNDLIYSFSTLDQTVKILPALDFDIADENIGKEGSKYVVDDRAADIQSRAINSPASGSEAPELPYWEPDKLALFKSELPQPQDAEGDAIEAWIVNLDVDNNGFSTVPLIYHMAALSDDGGIVSYSWNKKRNGSSVNNAEEPFYMSMDYIVTEDTEPAYTNKSYFYKEGNSYKIIPTGTSFSEYDEIYELVSTVTMDSVGRYTPFAQNREGKFFSDRISATPLYVPYPATPELDDLVATPENILRGEGEEAIPVTLTCDVELKDEFGNDVKETGGKATYVWKRSGLNRAGLEEGEGFEVLDGMVDDRLVLSAADDDDEGYYFVTITNNLNKEAKSETSNVVRVTKPAQKVVLSIDTEDDMSIEVARTRTDKLAVTVENLEPYRDERSVDNPDGEDYVTYQWYAYASSGSNVNTDKELARVGMYADATGGVNGDDPVDDTFTTDEQSLTSAVTKNFVPPIEKGERTYFCVVTNHYNGTEKAVASPFYHVVP